MIKVNISCSKNWNFEEVLDLHSPGATRVWGGMKFYLNQESGFFDYWIVLGDLDKCAKLNVTKGNTFFVTMEERDVINTYPKEFLNQFDHLITTRDDLIHNSVILDHYFTKWHIQKSYDELIESCHASPKDKSKELSAIISCRADYGIHLKRFGFINKLKGHFKSRLDWYSKEDNPLLDKWDGLSDYRFSIAIENGSHSRYFTEKVVDVILSDCIPLYFGAPDISAYFPKELIQPLDLSDFEASIERIEKLIESNNYLSHLENIRESKLKILNEYQFFPWFHRILNQNGSNDKEQRPYKIYPKYELSFLKRVKNKLYNYRA